MEPERPIEKALKAYAEQRRREAGDGPELHPATRRLLQGEVTRRYGVHKPRVTWGWSPLMSRGRLLWALGMIVVAGFLVVLVLPRRSSSDRSVGTLAQLKTLPPAPTAATPAAAPTEVATVDRAEAKADKAMEKSAASAAAGGAAPAPIQNSFELAAADAKLAARPGPGDLPVQDSLGVQRDLSKKEVADAPALVPPAAEPAGASRRRFRATNGVADNAQGVLASAARAQPARRFARVDGPDENLARRETTAAPTSSILQTFDVTRTGQELRIVDSDESVYVGSIESVSDAPAILTEEKDKSTTVRGLQGSPILRQGFVGATPVKFRVMGTNRTSNALVILEGTLMGGTNSVSRSVSSGGSISVGLRAPVNLSGKLIIGGGPATDFSATAK